MTLPSAWISGGTSLLPHERSLTEAYFNQLARGQMFRRTSDELISWLYDFNRRHKTRFTPDEFHALKHTNAFKEYMRLLKVAPAQKALARLDAQVDEVVDDYLDARTMAREAKDHKELRVAASDHLDRIGATRKKETPVVVQAVQIVLRSKNFTAENLLEASPVIETD